ncbi:MAG: ABC transporter substrate-binding protein [Phycisphaerae bacterium]|nr:ABC transporter substrate-binding protein [Phycisphaerae bacterium]NIP54445.1 ABC transporter substrate-binding protein [Phycisphaerae bacterium]NIS53304.1 ABC transporter substrate-binding protein [Phycisphaerae bacterium]NIU10830.1 ABC transporter substrate-binding protein [Phycisphaerae bacterium]NIU58625.1 ABC transporter substrate-binding protein [Phycisphaerae bacterium]
MKKLWWLLAIILCLAGAGFIIFGFPKPQNRTAPPLPGKPARIVSLAPNLTEILFALGLDEQIVAVSNDCDFPLKAADKKKIGTFWQPNTEAILAAKPDLVVTLWFEQQKAVADSLKRLGYRILTLKIEKIEELLTAIKEIGTATDSKAKADQLLKNINNQLNDLQLKLDSVNKVRVLWVVQAEPLRVAGRNTFINELIELAGGENAIGNTLQQYPSIGTEEILACGAETIIQSAMGKSSIAEQQKAAEKFWSKWEHLPAVKNNRIYVVEPDTVTRLGPRLCQGVELIARCLHPDIFAQKQNAAQQVR